MNSTRFKRFITQSPFWQSAVFSLVLILGCVASIYFVVTRQDELLILHYSIPFGIDLLGQWYEMYYLPAWGFGIFIIDYVIAFFLYTSNRVASNILVISSVCVQCILSTALYLIIEQNSL